MHGYLHFYNKKLSTISATVHLQFLHVGTMEGTTSQLPELATKIEQALALLSYLSIGLREKLKCWLFRDKNTV